jgi:3-phosphoshikimate 1-carboxyvinyltransferase
MGAPFPKAVLDAAFAGSGVTRLVERARAGGARVVDARTFWRAQGRRQMRALLGIDLPPGQLAAEAGALEAAPTRPHRRRTLALTVPGSKSETQRALVLAALADAPVVVRGASPAADGELLRAALARLGAPSRRTGHDVRVTPARSLAAVGPLWCGDAGTCVRFLAALAPIVSGPLVLDGSPRLAERPLGGLLAALGRLGVRAACTGRAALPLRLEAASAPADRVGVDARETSQFASALLLVASRLPRGLQIELPAAPVSAAYLDLTVDLLGRFGVPVSRQGLTWRVPPHPVAAAEVVVGGDWSLAASWRVAARLLEHELPLRGLDPDSVQPDRAIDALLARLDAPGDVTLDLGGCPDLLPPLAVAALFARGPVRLTGLAHARLKESDRVAVLARALAAVGADVVEHPDGLQLAPLRSPRAAALHPAGDHRMAMAFAVLGLRVPGVVVREPGVVAKSYPAFWDHLEAVRCAR